MSLARQYIDQVTQKFGEAALAFLKPEIDERKAKDEKRRNSRSPTGNPRGRPRLTPAEAEGIEGTAEGVASGMDARKASER